MRRKDDIIRVEDAAEILNVSPASIFNRIMAYNRLHDYHDDHPDCLITPLRRSEVELLRNVMREPGRPRHDDIGNVR